MNIQTAAQGVYQDMITSQLAESISRSGCFGLAKGLEVQLQQQLDPTEAPEAELSGRRRDTQTI
jgi:Rod binding domain-containing protein